MHLMLIAPCTFYIGVLYYRMSIKNYIASGDVQGVGFRKTLHTLLDKHKIDGLAVNDPITRNVHIMINGPEHKHKRVLEAAVNIVEAKTKVPVKVKKGKKAKSKDVVLTKDELMTLNKLWHLKFLQGDKVNPREDTDKHPMWKWPLQRAMIAKKYRLKKDKDGNLTGKLPDLAYDQLTGRAMPYKMFMQDNMRRGIKAALKYSRDLKKITPDLKEMLARHPE